MNLELKTLADQLGIAEYPEVLEGAFEEVMQCGPITDIVGTLQQLHEEFAPFGEYYDFLLHGADAVQNDEALLTWLSIAFRFCKDADEKTAASVPLPPFDKTLGKDVLPALLVVMEFPETVKRYRDRGFDDAQIKKNLENLRESIHVHEITQGRPALNLYGWMTHYIKALIFDFMGFNFQAWKWKDEAIMLKHRTTDEHVLLLLKGNFTAEGTVAGMRGAEDVPAAIEATVEETDDAFIGYRAIGQRINTVRQVFAKSEWEAVLRPDDDVINFHIPRGADFTPAIVEESIKKGAELTARYYPECNFRYTVCTSWMLDPKLLDILPEGSKIAHFIRHFLLHPSGDTAGNACMSYVFPGENDVATENLPEKTSLQRGIKNMMLGGKYNFWTTGVWM